MYGTTIKCILRMFEKQFSHYRSLSVKKVSKRVVHVHSLLMDTKISNPLILSVSCRRLFFSPEGLHFCFKAHRKSRGYKLLSGRHSCTSNHCVFVCLHCWPMTVCTKSVPRSPPVFTTLQSVVMSSIFGILLMLKHIFLK